MGDKITMSEKELNRLRPIHQTLSGQISQIETSKIKTSAQLRGAFNI